MTPNLQPAAGCADSGVPDRDGPRDECGVFGVYAPGHEVARLAYFALYALQHRGQESAGIASCEGGHITTLRETGLVSPGLRRAEAARARRRHGDRPRPLLDHRRWLLGEQPAGLARRRPRGRAGAQRQPHQRGRALRRAARTRDLVPRHVGLGDHRRAALGRADAADRERGRRGDAAPRGRLLHRRDDEARRGRVPRPERGSPAVAGQARRTLVRRLGELRVRHHRRRADARGAARGGDLARRATGSRAVRSCPQAAPRTASSSTSTSRGPIRRLEGRCCRRSAAGWARSSGTRRRSTPTS